MKRINFLTNAMIPGALSLALWDREHFPDTNEVVLNNALASETGVSEMNINIAGISAVSDEGVEYKITDFAGGKRLKIAAMQSGAKFRTSDIGHFVPGKYSTLKFYLQPQGNSFTYSDRTVNHAPECDYLEFKIEGGLEILQPQAHKLVMWFDLPPYRHGKLLAATIQRLQDLRMKKVRNAAA